MNTNELYEGEKIKIRGREYIVPGLSFGQIERLADKIEQISISGNKLTKEMIQAITEITYAALSRNYPEITQDEVKEMLDTRNMQNIFEAIMGASGFNNGGNAENAMPIDRNLLAANL